MAVNLLPPIPQDKIEENVRWREWFRNLGNYISQAQNGNIVNSIATGGTGATTAAGARNNLGLGTMSTQNETAVNITGGNLSGVTVTASSLTGNVALTNSTATTATAGTHTLPSSPVGFVIVNINGTNFKLPYYNL